MTESKKINVEKNKVVFFHVYDGQVFEFGRTMTELTDAAHKNDKVNIHFGGEGADLSSLNYKESKLLDILSDLCEQNNWPKEKFNIITGNLVQDRSVWPSIYYWDHLLQPLENNTFLFGQSIQYNKIKNPHNHFGCLINNSTFPRLLISSHLFNQHRSTTFQTFRRDKNNAGHMLNLEMDRVLSELSAKQILDQKALNEITNFIMALPMEKHNDQSLINTGHFDWRQGAYHTECLEWYQHFFIDVVCETFYSGDVFLLTEKTARAVMTGSPFVVFGPRHYLKNLRRLGFKTFSNIWDESYDNYEGMDRVTQIKNLIDTIAKIPIQKLLSETKSTVEHNKNLYYNIKGEQILKEFDQVNYE